MSLDTGIGVVVLRHRRDMAIVDVCEQYTSVSANGTEIGLYRVMHLGVPYMRDCKRELL